MYSTIGVVSYLFFCVLVGVAAERMMYRSFWGWTLLAILFLPVTAFVFLQVAGPPLRAANQVRKDEEAKRQSKIVDAEQRAKDAEYRAEDTCPSCGSPINLPVRASNHQKMHRGGLLAQAVSRKSM